jgi:FkbM family methyltransferase
MTMTDSDGLFPLRGGLRVAAPASLDLITPYVLLEQEDWFEDEIRFVRRLVRPGQRALDVGAAYGVYALTLARLCGPAGRVVAVEPARATLTCLQRSVAENGLGNLVLCGAALSDREGQAELQVGPHAELNRLTSGGSGPAGALETVRLLTLDRLAQEHGLSGLDFVKLDAEGEEARILAGAARLLAESSPLVMFELKHGDQLDLALIAAFADLGYRTYELVPGLSLLAPFSPEPPPDPFRLNLFACKEDRALALAAEGLLALPGRTDLPPCDPELIALLLADRPYASAFAEAWDRQSPGLPEARTYRLALAEYARCHLFPGAPAAARYAALCQAQAGLSRAADAQPTVARLQSLARVTTELGQRLPAVQILDRLARRLGSGAIGVAEVSEPFLPVAPRYDRLPAAHGPHFMMSFLLASVLEQREKLRAFSSYYTGREGLPGLERIQQLGLLPLMDPEISRRITLIRERYSLTR